MRKIIVSFCFIISTVMCSGIVAQNINANIEKSNKNPSSTTASDSVNAQKWTNQVERFVGVWSLENTVVDDKGVERKVYPGTFMVVHPNASYVIFVSTNLSLFAGKGLQLVFTESKGKHNIARCLKTLAILCFIPSATLRSSSLLCYIPFATLKSHILLCFIYFATLKSTISSRFFHFLALRRPFLLCFFTS